MELTPLQTAPRGSGPTDWFVSIPRGSGIPDRLPVYSILHGLLSLQMPALASLMRTASTDKPIFPEIRILWRKSRPATPEPQLLTAAPRHPASHGPLSPQTFLVCECIPGFTSYHPENPCLPVVLKQPGPEAAPGMAGIWPSDACPRVFNRGPGGVLRPHPLPAFRPKGVSN